RLDRWCLAIGCTAAGRPNTQPCPTWMLMQLMFLSSRSFWRTKAGSETRRSLNLKRSKPTHQAVYQCCSAGFWYRSAHCQEISGMKIAPTWSGPVVADDGLEFALRVQRQML